MRLSRVPSCDLFCNVTTYSARHDDLAVDFLVFLIASSFIVLQIVQGWTKHSRGTGHAHKIAAAISVNDRGQPVLIHSHDDLPLPPLGSDILLGLSIQIV